MLQFNIHNDQGAAKSYNFKVDAKYPAVSFPIFALQSNIPNNKNNIFGFLITHFAVGMFLETFKFKKKNCLKS